MSDVREAIGDDDARSGLPIARLYAEAVESFIELAESLDEREWATRCPCTPAWTVRDILSHVSGIPDDALAGRLEGVTTEPWTASQVARNARFSVAELLERWHDQCSAFAEAIESIDQYLPPFDCATHEHDVRQAIGRPGNRDSDIVRLGAERLAIGLVDLPVAITLEFDDGTTIETGDPTAPTAVVLTTTRFEAFRSRLGRRSRQQVREFAWSGPGDAIDTVVDAWFAFGPSELPITE